MAERTFSLDGSGEGLSPAPDSGVAGDALGAVSLPSGDGSGSDDGSGSGSDFVFDPERHIGADRRNADGSYRRKRRRRGSGSSDRGPARQKTRTDYSASVDALSNTLVIIHAGIASVTKITELNLDKNEGDALAGSLANMLAEFDITPDPKVQAIIGLVVTAGTIYGPRMYLYNERMKKERRKPATIATIGGEVVAPEFMQPD